MIHVAIYNEYIHERESECVAAVYPQGIHAVIADFLRSDEIDVKCFTLDTVNEITDEELKTTDVMIWWGHKRHDAVPDEVAARVRNAVQNGMGIIFLHSAHHSKPFKFLMGTCCHLTWREDGDMEFAINDMSIYRKMTPEFIETKTNLMENSTLVAVDANLPEETIEAIVRHTTAPIFAEPVSAAKASKFKKVLKYIHTITPNIIEAEALTGMTIDIDDGKTVAAAADKLLDAGVKQVIITMGNRGVYYKSAEEEGFLQPVKAKLVNTTGAGDALFAGIATGYCKGLTLTDSVKLGMAAAAVTIETTETNNKELSYEVAINRAKIKGVK